MSNLSLTAESRKTSVVSTGRVAIIMSAARRMSPELHDAFPNAVVITDGELAQVPRVAGTNFVHEAIHVSSMNAFDEILNAIRHSKAEAVVTPFETGLPAGAFARTVLGLPGTGVRQAVHCTDKYLMKRCFRSAGVRSAEFKLLKNIPELEAARSKFGGQMVVKPLFGGGSAGVKLVDECMSAQDLQFPLLGERALSVTSEFHVDGIVANGRLEFAIVSQYGEPMLASVVATRTYSSSILDQTSEISTSVRAMVASAVTAVGLSAGVIHAEVLAENDRLVMGEIACRPSGGGVPHALRLATGIDLTRISWQIDCGQTVQFKRPETTKRIWHAALPASLKEESRQRLSSLDGHLCTTTAAGQKPLKSASSPIEVSPVVAEKKVFYSATNDGCVYFDLDVNPSAPALARAILEEV